jgi:Spy/CpxP family protein refolding chaperone
MNLKRAVRVVLSAFFSLVLSTAVLRADPKGDGAGKDWEAHREAHFKEMRDKLGLSPDQEKQLQENRKTNQGKMKALREENQTKREALRTELEKPDLDIARINALKAELKDVHNRMDDQRLDGILAVRKILTPDQFKKFSEMIREGEGKGGPDHGKGLPHHREGSPEEE